MSGDPEQEYFSDGISEDIITDLSKIAGLTVIARNSSFTFKGRSVDIRDVGRDFGVHSVLEGSIRRAGKRVRITAQLIDAATGAHLWADRYDRDLTDIFEVQDDVTRRIVDALKVTLTPAENTRLGDNGTPNIEAYDCYLRGREVMAVNPKTRERFEQSTKLFLRALELDPSYSQAYAALSMAYGLDYQNRWSDDPDSSLRLAKHNVEQAIEKNANEPFARLVASWTAILEKDLSRAKSEADIALSLNPNYSGAYLVLGHIQTLSGRSLEAIPALERATRLDPAFRPTHLHFLGMAYLLAGKYENAAALLRERILLLPETDFSRVLLATRLDILMTPMRLIAYGGNSKRSIQNIPLPNITPGSRSRDPRMSKESSTVFPRLACRSESVRTLKISAFGMAPGSVAFVRFYVAALFFWLL